MPKRFKKDAFVTLDEVADEFGYALTYLKDMATPGDNHADPDLVRLRVQTDETFREAYGVKAKHVFVYGELQRWFANRQARPTVQAYNASRGIIVG